MQDIPFILITFPLIKFRLASELAETFVGSNYVCAVTFSFLSSANLISMPPVSSFQLTDSKCNPDVSWRHPALWGLNKFSSSPLSHILWEVRHPPQDLCKLSGLAQSLAFPDSSYWPWAHVYPTSVAALSSQVHASPALSPVRFCSRPEEMVGVCVCGGEGCCGYRAGTGTYNRSPHSFLESPSETPNRICLLASFSHVLLTTIQRTKILGFQTARIGVFICIRMDQSRTKWGGEPLSV